MKLQALFVLLVITSVLISGCTSSPDKTIVIGSKLFQESFILGHMISLLLEDNGYKTDVKVGLGGTLINYEALKKGQIHTYVEYTGTAYSQILKRPPLEVWDPQVVYGEAEKGLAEQDGVLVVGKLGFEDAYAIAVKEDWLDSILINVKNSKKYQVKPILHVPKRVGGCLRGLILQ